MTEINLSDIQGFILRGYRIDVARFFVLNISDPGPAKSFIKAVVSGDNSFPQITTAEDWGPVKPEYCLNIGFTYEGLKRLQLPEESLTSFPNSFQLGATSSTTAQTVGDIGESAPANWIGGLSNAAQVHIVLALYTHQDRDREAWSKILRSLFEQYGITELSYQDSTPLPNDKIHFGYTDGIAQPHIVGSPGKAEIPDCQPTAPTGEFLMGYPSQNPNQTYQVSPPALSLNSSFAAFRILMQDVAAFDAFLETSSAQSGIDKEMLAAKVCGRWRNGTPLMLSPETQHPNPPVPPKLINSYDYVANNSTPDCAEAPDDTFGYICPIGAHMRRNNPRSDLVIGSPDEGHLHRILRRAIPYGPEYDPANPDEIERGLIGMFINVDLANQFEFLTSQWSNTSSFVRSVHGPGGANPVNNISGQDIFLGINDETNSSFTLSTPQGNQKIKGFGRFVITRGGAYCYLPSITAMKYLASLQST